MLRRHERLRASDRVAAVRAWTSWRDLRTRQFLSPESDSAWKACHRHWEWGVHQEVAQPLPHVRGSRQHRGLASSLRDLQEYIPLGKFIWPIKYFLKKFYFIINKFPPDNVSFVLCYAKEVLNKLTDHYLVRGSITALPTSCCSFHTINNRFNWFGWIQTSNTKGQPNWDTSYYVYNRVETYGKGFCQCNFFEICFA